MKAKHRRFCEEYIIDLDGTAAAIRAKYSAKRAKVTASELLKRQDVKDYLSQVQKKVADKLEFSAIGVLDQLKKIVFNDPRKFFDEHGNMIPIKDLPDDCAAALSSIEINEEFQTVNNVKIFTGYTKKIKFWDKNAAVDKAMKHLGLFEKDNEQSKPMVAPVINVKPKPSN